MLHDANAQRVDQRIALVTGVKHRAAADIWQAKRVAVAAHAAHHAVHHARRVGVGYLAKAQFIHDGDRPRAHRQDVAHDAADPRGRALVRLHIRRVVVALDLEGHGPAVADVDDPRVLADAHHEVFLHGVGGLLAKLLEVHLRRLIGTVLRPHHRIHREFRVRGAAAKQFADLRVLGRFEPKRSPRLFGIWRGGGNLNRVELTGDGVGHEFPQNVWGDGYPTSVPGPDVGAGRAANGLASAGTWPAHVTTRRASTATSCAAASRGLEWPHGIARLGARGILRRGRRRAVLDVATLGGGRRRSGRGAHSRHRSLRPVGRRGRARAHRPRDARRRCPHALGSGRASGRRAIRGSHRSRGRSRARSTPSPR